MIAPGMSGAGMSGAGRAASAGESRLRLVRGEGAYTADLHAPRPFVIRRLHQPGRIKEVVGVRIPFNEGRAELVGRQAVGKGCSDKAASRNAYVVVQMIEIQAGQRVV